MSSLKRFLDSLVSFSFTHSYVSEKLEVASVGEYVKKGECLWAFQVALTVKRTCRRPRLDPWVRKIPCWREWVSTPVFLPGEFHGQRSLAGYSPWGHKELDMTEWLTIWLLLSYIYWWECKFMKPPWKTVCRCLKKIKIELPYDTAILLPCIYPKKKKILILKDVCCCLQALPVCPLPIALCQHGCSLCVLPPSCLLLSLS